jgi:hypothetical protein
MAGFRDAAPCSLLDTDRITPCNISEARMWREEYTYNNNCGDFDRLLRLDSLSREFCWVQWINFLYKISYVDLNKVITGGCLF